MKDLNRISENGKFTIAAMDHRGSLRKLLGTESREEIVAFKKRLMGVLGPLSSAILIDPDYGLEILSDKPEGVGLLLALEKSGYGKKKPELVANWGVGNIKEKGAAAKLLLYCKPGEWHEDLVKKLSDECREKGAVFLLEPILYDVEKSEENILRMVGKYSELVDVLKLEYPGSLEMCKKVTESSTVPWVLLSRGMEYEKYKEALEVSMKAGASGFAVGRAIWQDLPDDEVIRKRYKELVEIVNSE